MTTRMSAAEYQTAELASLDERRFQDRIADAAFVCGWWVMHVPKVRDAKGRWRTVVAYQGVGYPDLTMAHEAFGVIVAEIKTATGSLSREERAWRKRLEAAPGVRYRLWRPKHWGQILSELEGQVEGEGS